MKHGNLYLQRSLVCFERTPVRIRLLYWTGLGIRRPVTSTAASVRLAVLEVFRVGLALLGWRKM